MKCPKCGHRWKDKAKAAGGKKSRRLITPEQQAKMQEGRGKSKKVGEEIKTTQCPECSCEHTIEEHDDEMGVGYRVCESCLQEWYTTTDYT